MKRILRRSTLVLIFTIAFIVGIGFFTAELVIGAKDWIAQPYNAHISGHGGLEEAGKIIDRNGAVLAETVNGERTYSSDESVRKALLHTVGDNSLNISTAVQSKYRSLLTNYSLIWGLNMPQSMRTSRDITLTVDSQSCKDAYEALEATGKKGACVIYNYKTGEVICSVSNPTYDPQNPPEITKENEKEYDGVYLDNVLSSSYVPGSIFKIITAAAAIENNLDLLNQEYICYCEGYKNFGGNDVRCNDGEAHGEVDLKTAMHESCNVAFAELAVALGGDKMQAMADKIGINRSFTVDDTPTAKGNYNAKNADDNMLAWTGIGQGFDASEDRVNPMQMAIICGAIANRGKAANPTYIQSGTGGILELIGIKQNETHDLIRSDTAEKVDAVMRSYTVGGVDCRAKTGTAETTEGNNAWFVGYSADPSCPLAFACVVEGAKGYGSEYAIPIVDAAMSSAAYAVRGY